MRNEPHELDPDIYADSIRRVARNLLTALGKALEKELTARVIYGGDRVAWAEYCRREVLMIPHPHELDPDRYADSIRRVARMLADDPPDPERGS